MAVPKTRRSSIVKTITDIKTHNLQSQIEQLQAELNKAVEKLTKEMLKNTDLQAENEIKHKALKDAEIFMREFLDTCETPMPISREIYRNIKEALKGE